MGQLGAPRASQEQSRGGLGRSWAGLGRSWDGLGVIFGWSWGGLGAVLAALGPLVAALGRSWGGLGVSWGSLGVLLAALGRSWGLRRRFRIDSGSFGGRFGVKFDKFGVDLDLCLIFFASFLEVAL